MFCGLVGWGVLSDTKCNYLLKILAVEYILLLQFCNKFGLGVVINENANSQIKTSK